MLIVFFFSDVHIRANIKIHRMSYTYALSIYNKSSKITWNYKTISRRQLAIRKSPIFSVEKRVVPVTAWNLQIAEVVARQKLYSVGHEQTSRGLKNKFME